MPESSSTTNNNKNRVENQMFPKIRVGPGGGTSYKTVETDLEEKNAMAQTKAKIV